MRATILIKAPVATFSAPTFSKAVILDCRTSDNARNLRSVSLMLAA